MSHILHLIRQAVLNAFLTTPDQYKGIGVSSKHLKDEDVDKLDLAASESNVVVKRDTGWFIKLPAEQDFGALEIFMQRYGLDGALKDIMRMAMEGGYRLIEIDDEAREIPELIDYYQYDAKFKAADMVVYKGRVCRVVNASKRTGEWLYMVGEVGDITCVTKNVKEAHLHEYKGGDK